jgi:single-stranded DNA-binding protein
MLNLNRITLIGHTGADAKSSLHGPTTLTLATNTVWTDPHTKERRTRTEWHQLVIWNGLGRWAATLPKGTPLLVEGELIYEQYGRKVETVSGPQTVAVEVPVRVAKICVEKMIRLEAERDPAEEPAVA